MNIARLRVLEAALRREPVGFDMQFCETCLMGLASSLPELRLVGAKQENRFCFPSWAGKLCFDGTTGVIAAFAALFGLSWEEAHDLCVAQIYTRGRCYNALEMADRVAALINAHAPIAANLAASSQEDVGRGERGLLEPTEA